MEALYTHKVLYLELEDLDAPEGGPDIYVLPGEHDLRLVEGQIAEAQQKIEELAEAIDGCSDVEQAEKLRKELGVRNEMIAATRDTLAATRTDQELFSSEAKSYTFQMRRYSWNDKHLAREEARFFTPDGLPIIRDGAYVLALLTKCIIAWDVLGPDGQASPITSGTVGSLAPGIADTLFRRLQEKSEVSPERLAFLRSSRARSVGKQRKKS